MSAAPVPSHPAWKQDEHQAVRVAQAVDSLAFLVMSLQALGYSPNAKPSQYEELFARIRETADEAHGAASWCNEGTA